ncbi:MAG TPA: protein tyrosine phosphatase [Xanthobacteraceae bacterium]|nr:protein tyrosine phosphatase [Xanthobacteraceae bacterium]
MIHVCSLARLHATVDATGARHVVSLMKDVELVRRPPAIVDNNHLLLRMDDISMPLDGYTVPAAEHIEELLAFMHDWDRAAPLVMHCYAGVSRSTAGAFVSVCALNPRRDEAAIAQELRRLSPTATPNIRIVTIADEMLGRSGRMVHAIEAIGRGVECYEGHPFRLDLA